MKNLVLIILISFVALSAMAQEVDSTKVSPADAALMNENTMQEYGMVGTDDFKGKTIGFTSIKGPKFQSMSNDTASSPRSEFVAAIRSGVVLMENIRVAEIEQSRLDSALKEIVRGDDAIVARKQGIAQFGEFVKVDYIISQTWDYASWSAGFAAQDISPSAQSSLGINDQQANNSDQFMLMQMTALEDGSTVYFALAPDGFLQSPRVYSLQFNKILEHLAFEENPSNRAKLAAAYTYNGLYTSLSPQFLFQLRVFMISSAGTAGHALIQGNVLTKVILGAAGGYLAYFLRSSIGKIKNIKNEYADLAEESLADYNSASGKNLEFAASNSKKELKYYAVSD